ncbi:FAD binding domain-containing protein [Xylariaceae sp. FL0804]|nr:FAD binding domain-containing protein [Xylariaceae sp. FL0804]
MGGEQQQQQQQQQQQLHLIVIGGGLAGLAAAIATALAGHRCTLLEKAPGFHEVGAGLQLTPNSTRLLRSWGILDALEPVAAIPTTLTVRRFDGTRVLCGDEHWQENIMRLYGAPFWDVHRVDLQAALVARARTAGVAIRLGAEAADIDFDAAAVTLAPAHAGDSDSNSKGEVEVVRGDAVLAADGMWSRARELFFGRPMPPAPTGDLAYRIMLRLEDVEHDPELAAWVAQPTVNFWIGPRSHVVSYSVRAGSEFNIVLLYPDDLPSDCSRANGNVDEMRELFRDWDPLLTRFLNCVKSVDKWRLNHFPPLQTWNHESGRFTMAGDACHPMLPYLAQGANSAMEDGAVLGRLLGTIRDAAEVPRVLGEYQAQRRERVYEIAHQSSRQREDLHLPDGPEQQARDKIFTEGLPWEREYPSRWTCPKVQPWLFGYDALASA